MIKSGIRSYLTIGLGLPVCALIFLADLSLPLGVGIWLAYLAVILVAAWFGDRLVTLTLALLCTVLIVLGFFLSPIGIIPWIAGVNRGAGVVLIWGGAFLISSRRRLLSAVLQQAEKLAAANSQLQQQAEKLEAANLQLEQQAEKLAAANSQLEQQAEKLRAANLQLEQQAEELAVANELLQKQTEEVEVQAEELQAQNEDLVALTDSLGRRVQERTSELRQANESLQAMSAKLIAVQENERRVISRELHDESGQLLTTLQIRMGLLRDLWERGESPVDAIDELRQLADQLAEGLHRLAVNLRPASLDRAGLVTALQQYVHTYRKSYGLQVDLAVDGLAGDRLAPQLESTLYRIIQEALTNVARHAHASHVSVLLNQRPDTIAVIIEDDGVGFDAEAARNAGRLGMTGMRERAELHGGRLTVESQLGFGTSVFVEIPCPPRSPLSARTDSRMRRDSLPPLQMPEG